MNRKLFFGLWVLVFIILCVLIAKYGHYYTVTDLRVKHIDNSHVVFYNTQNEWKYTLQEGEEVIPTWTYKIIIDDNGTDLIEDDDFVVRFVSLHKSDG